MAWLSSLLHRLFVTGCQLLRYMPGRRRASSRAPRADSPRPDAPPPMSVAHVAPPTPSPPPDVKLLALPEDLLHDIVRRVTHSAQDGLSPGHLLMVEEASFRDSVALASTCRKLSTIFYHSLDRICLSSSLVDDDVLQSLSKNAASSLQCLVLRRCTGITNHSLYAIANRLHSLRSIDLSFVSVITDEGVIALCNGTAPRLRKLLLRQCEKIGNESLKAIGECKELETLDLSYCPKITDSGVFYFASGCGPSLRLLAISHNTRLTDNAFSIIGKYCRNLVQLCARGLPFVTDTGFRGLCEGLNEDVEGIDVIDCISLTREETLRTLHDQCRMIYSRVMPTFASKSLRQILISTLRQNIFIVHGSDPTSGSDTVHTVLVDNGDIVSASLLTSGTTDLSRLGVVLCKSFGSGLDEPTKKMLENDYGIPTSTLAE